MTTPKNYKQTELGLLPEDWEVKRLGDVAKIKMGQSPNSKYYNDSNIGLPLIQGNADILNRQTIIRNYTSQITKTCQVGDIIMSVRAPVGEIAKAIFSACIGRGVCAISYENNYLYNYLVFIENKWSKYSTGSTFDSINSVTLKSLPIPLPPLPEQKAIAEVLSDMDELIQSTESLIEKKKLIKKGAMQELLTGKRRLQGQTRMPAAPSVKPSAALFGYKQTELGLLPEDWEVKTIGDIFVFKNGLNKEKSFFGYGTPIINYMDVYHNSGLRKKDIAGKVSLSKDEISIYAVKRGDVFFTRTSETVEEIGVASVLLEDIENCVFSGFLLRARPKTESLINEYKKYCFSSSLIRKDIVSKSSYTTRALTNGKLLSSIPIPLPPLPEQKAIAEVLSDMDEEIHTLEKKLEKQKSIKQGMMQELLTGKTRLV